LRNIVASVVDVQNGREVNRLLADETEALVFTTFPFHGLRAHGFLELQVVQSFRFKKQKRPGRAKHARRSREVADSNVQVFHIYIVSLLSAIIMHAIEQ
jgi:hypothetical protein